jgi:hypothetical protein
MWKNDEYVEYVRPKCFDNDLSSTTKKKCEKRGRTMQQKPLFFKKIEVHLKGRPRR